MTNEIATAFALLFVAGRGAHIQNTPAVCGETMEIPEPGAWFDVSLDAALPGLSRSAQILGEAGLMEMHADGKQWRVSGTAAVRYRDWQNAGNWRKPYPPDVAAISRERESMQQTGAI